MLWAQWEGGTLLMSYIPDLSEACDPLSDTCLLLGFSDITPVFVLLLTLPS